PVELMGRLHVEAVALQPLVERVHLLPAILPEADVKGPWVGDLRRLGEVVQGQNEPRLVNQHDEGVALAPRNAPEAKVRLEERPCLRYIRNSEIEVVQCHVCVPPRAGRHPGLDDRFVSCSPVSGRTVRDVARYAFCPPPFASAAWRPLMPRPFGSLVALSD